MIVNPKSTWHFGVEGKDDKAFVEHLVLKAGNTTDLASVSVNISTSFGQSAPAVVGLLVPVTADLRVAIVDKDRLHKSSKESRNSTQLAKANDISLVVLAPCLDAVLLAIIGDTSTLNDSDCNYAKLKIGQLLNPNYAPNLKLKNFFEQNISIRKLNRARGYDSGLDQLLDIFNF